MIDVRRVAPNATVNVWGTVSGAAHLELDNATMRPDEVNLTFFYDFTRGLWRFQIWINGSRILRNGQPGRSAMSVTFCEHDIDQAPQWVRDFVSAHMPSGDLDKIKETS